MEVTSKTNTRSAKWLCRTGRSESVSAQNVIGVCWVRARPPAPRDLFIVLWAKDSRHPQPSIPGAEYFTMAGDGMCSATWFVGKWPNRLGQAQPQVLCGLDHSIAS